MVSDSDISFVVQGPILHTSKNATALVLKSIRLFFPNSEIILSTWMGENTENLEYDQLVKSEPPESISIYKDQKCNINKQILSTINGIKQAKNRIIVKTRTNTVFGDNVILKKFKEIKTESVFKNFVITINLFTRDPYKSTIVSYRDGFLHHPSDIFLMGLKDDLLDWFSLEMATESILRNKSGLGILVPEQYLWMSFLIKKNKLKNYTNSLVKYNPISCYQSEKWLFENFQIYNHKSLGLQLEDRLEKGWMYETVVEENFQQKINSMKKYQRNLYFFFRALYYCLIYNRFWRKNFNSLNKRILKK